MKQLLITLSLFVFVACEQAPKADKANITAAKTVQAGTGQAYIPDTATSRVEWIGTKPTGKHHGFIKLAGGAIYLKDSLITGGELIMNMKSMQDLDLVADTAMKNKLEAELKGSQFFDVQNFPTATFEITEVAPYQPAKDGAVTLLHATHIIKGNLTLKGVTKNISFPASITIENQEIITTANFNIDRTQWGITYRADKSLQDKLINSQVNITFHVKASR
ncbi:YceI family protein [Chitinophaga silvatica]|uniref:YceI family protein n=1 Tax=Chitinophaga silvatica TaxID=2282649 RepID=A0A3E1YCY8_9BACT|nr:YceI family protein [Chitinophaga silvatica]RFS23894.1 YceI family protein [Chitinophaga silvatica]